VYPRSALVLCVVFVVLAALVGAGVFTDLDQWSIEHLMPGASFGTGEPSLIDSLVPLHSTDWTDPWSVAVNVVTLPASFLVALVLIAWRSRLLAVAALVCVAVEVVFKHVLDRPPLYDGPLHIVAFDSSFPSGHTLRTVLLVAAFLPVLGWVAAAWGVVSLSLLELAGWHTPTDVIGGVLLGLLGAAAAGALRARRLRAPAGRA
jgi:membrane-associated phospholipid phosphatase